MLPSCPAKSAKFQSAQAELGRHWNNQIQSQPNPDLRGDGTLCNLLHFVEACTPVPFQFLTYGPLVFMYFNMPVEERQDGVMRNPMCEAFPRIASCNYYRFVGRTLYTLLTVGRTKLSGSEEIDVQEVA